LLSAKCYDLRYIRLLDLMAFTQGELTKDYASSSWLALVGSKGR